MDEIQKVKTGGGTGTPSPPSFWVLTASHPLQPTRSLFIAQQLSSEAGRSRCRSLRSFFISRMRSTRLRAPADIESWRTQLQPIRTIGEITARIEIFPVHQPYLYQKLCKKAIQLRLLGMSYGEIAKSLNINRKTATKAFEYQRR